MERSLGVDHCAVMQQQPSERLELQGQVAQAADGMPTDAVSERLQLVARGRPPCPRSVVADLIAG
jgi:hypothetical protein